LDQAWNDVPEVDAARKKVKSIIWPLTIGNVPQNAKHELYPISLWPPP